MSAYFEKFLNFIFRDIRITTVILIMILTIVLFIYRYFKNKENKTNDDIL